MVAFCYAIKNKIRMMKGKQIFEIIIGNIAVILGSYLLFYQENLPVQKYIGFTILLVVYNFWLVKKLKKKLINS
jgi:uncharacterized membrane protein YfcA